MQIGERQARHNKRVKNRRGIHGAVHHDMVTMIRYSAMELESGRAYLEGCEEMASAEERKVLEEKVDLWRVLLAPVAAININ